MPRGARVFAHFLPGRLYDLPIVFDAEKKGEAWCNVVASLPAGGKAHA